MFLIKSVIIWIALIATLRYIEAVKVDLVATNFPEGPELGLIITETYKDSLNTEENAREVRKLLNPPNAGFVWEVDVHKRNKEPAIPPNINSEYLVNGDHWYLYVTQIKEH